MEPTTILATGLSVLLGVAPGLIAIAKYIEHLFKRRHEETQKMVSYVVARALAHELQPIRQGLAEVHELLFDHAGALAELHEDLDQIHEWIKADPGKRPLPELRRRDLYRSRPPARHRDLRARA